MSMPAKKRPTASAPSARAHLEQAIALYDPQQHRSLAFTYGEQAGVPTQGFAAQVSWALRSSALPCRTSCTCVPRVQNRR